MKLWWVFVSFSVAFVLFSIMFSIIYLRDKVDSEFKDRNRDLIGDNDVFGPEEKYCEVDEDCVSATCCHASEVVNKNYAPDCSNIACTTVCQSILDCGCGKPICINNKCEIEKTNESYCP